MNKITFFLYFDVLLKKKKKKVGWKKLLVHCFGHFWPLLIYLLDVF